MECIFCSIIAKTLPATFLYEDEQMVVFPDIHPKARIHLLVVPKIHVGSLAQTTESQEPLLGAMLARAREMAKAQGIAERGYKIVINTGAEGGQVIGHLHLHLLGGEPIRTMV